MKSSIEELYLPECVDVEGPHRINRRQKESYNERQMAEWIQENDFRLYNKPVIARITDERLKHKWGLGPKGLAVLQGHQRRAGLLYLRKHFAEFGLTEDEAEMLLHQECEVLEALSEQECRDIAYDARYQTGLLRWEVVLAIRALADQGNNNAEIAAYVGHDICKNAMITKGNAVWREYISMREYKVKRKFLADKCSNVIKHVVYAHDLGNWFDDILEIHFKYERDGLKPPEGLFKPFDADWQRVNRLYSAKVNSTDPKKAPRGADGKVADPWQGPVTAVQFDADNKYVISMTGGNKAVLACLQDIVREVIDGKPEEKKAPTTKRQEEINDKLLAEEYKALAECLLVTGNFSRIPELDALLRRNRETFKLMEESFDKIPQEIRYLAEATVKERDPAKVVQLWIEWKCPQAPGAKSSKK